MKSTGNIKTNISTLIIKELESQYDWSGKLGTISLKELKIIIKALEGIGYTSKQIIKELKSYDIHLLAAKLTLKNKV